LIITVTNLLISGQMLCKARLPIKKLLISTSRNYSIW